MVCVTMPTKQGYKEMLDIQHNTIDELEDASNEMYDS